MNVNKIFDIKDLRKLLNIIIIKNSKEPFFLKALLPLFF